MTTPSASRETGNSSCFSQEEFTNAIIMIINKPTFISMSTVALQLWSYKERGSAATTIKYGIEASPRTFMIIILTVIGPYRLKGHVGVPVTRRGVGALP